MTLTLDRVLLHTVMHHSSSCTYIPNFVEIEETFCGRTDVWMDILGTLLGRLGPSRPKNIDRPNILHSVRIKRSAPRYPRQQQLQGRDSAGNCLFFHTISRKTNAVKITRNVPPRVMEHMKVKVTRQIKGINTVLVWVSALF